MAANTGIAGIPLNALDAVQDQNARAVLQALVDGWHVRNGQSGSGDAAFLTKADLTGLSGGGGNGQTYNLGGLRVTAGDISRVINDLHTQVFESKLFKDLESRVDLIDKPGGIFDRLGATEIALSTETNQRIVGDTGLSTRIDTMGIRVGNAESAIQTEINQRVNADNAIQTTMTTQYASVNQSLALQQSSITTNANNVAALATSLNQLQVSLNAQSVAIAQESQARINADNQLYAQYTVKVDVNGYVSGFGLASSDTVSDFIVRADRFSIVSPTGNRAALIITNNTINVFDENGALRVKIGRLA
jgi:hypothetical protein